MHLCGLIFSYDDVLSHKVLVDMVHGMSCHCEVSGFQIKREQGPGIDQSCWNNATSPFLCCCCINIYIYKCTY
jgi:hypothetical protein